MMGIVGSVHGEKDLANLADIFFAGFSNPNHDSPAGSGTGRLLADSLAGNLGNSKVIGRADC